jgi:hypothetical protein
MNLTGIDVDIVIDVFAVALDDEFAVESVILAAEVARSQADNIDRIDCFWRFEMRG